MQNLNLHETIKLENCTIIRVPGGWVYKFKKSSCFVPLNSEFSSSKRRIHKLNVFSDEYKLLGENGQKSIKGDIDTDYKENEVLIIYELTDDFKETGNKLVCLITSVKYKREISLFPELELSYFK